MGCSILLLLKHNVVAILEQDPKRGVCFLSDRRQTP